jgi:expansin
MAPPLRRYKESSSPSRLALLAAAVLVLALPPGCGDDSSEQGGAAVGGGGSASGGGGKSAAAGSTAASGGNTTAAGGNTPGAGGGAAGGTAGQGTGAACAFDAVAHKGDGTFYDATGEGNCSFPATPGDLMVGAMNDADYLGSAVCGSCAHIKGPAGEVTVRIVDRCPECKPGDIDLSPQAFATFAPLEKGRVAITWSYVACDVAGPIAYHFKDGSNQWWTAVQIRNHRFPIKTFEYRLADGSYKPVDRVSYNFFVDPNGMGPGPYTFRITDTLGHVIEDADVPLLDNADAAGSGQFPVCSP